MIGALFVLAAGAVALLARNTRQTTPVVEAKQAQEPALDLAAYAAAPAERAPRTVASAGALSASSRPSL